MTTGREREHAVELAQAVVGFYGDPTVSWSIMLDTELVRPADPSLVHRRLSAAVAEHPHCGLPPEWEIVEHEAWEAHREGMANRPYAVNEPLVRGASSPDGTRLAIAVHHGVADGLGLLSLLGAALNLDLRSQARGIAAAPAERAFLETCARRAVEIAVRPPRRFRAESPTGAAGCHLETRSVDARVDTARLVAATAGAVETWNSAEPRGVAREGRPIVIAIGASRRPAGAPLLPNRETAYLRVVAPDPGDVTSARALLTKTAPEPDFPVASAGGLLPMVTRVLRGRLGSTALVSNLGRITGDEGAIGRLALFSQASGPHGVAIGAVTVGETSTVSIRARQDAFSAAATGDILDLLQQELRAF